MINGLLGIEENSSEKAEGNTKAEEKSITNKIAIYNITITNQEKEVVALFKGTVYRTDKLF